MPKILRVIAEAGCDSQTTYHRIPDDYDEKDQKRFAEDVFFDWANFGFSIVDEDQVPDYEEIVE